MALDIERAKRDGLKLMREHESEDITVKYIHGPNSYGRVVIQSDDETYSTAFENHLYNLPDPIERCREMGVVIAQLWEGRWSPVRNGKVFQMGNWWPLEKVSRVYGHKTELESARAMLEYQDVGS